MWNAILTWFANRLGDMEDAALFTADWLDGDY